MKTPLSITKYYHLVLLTAVGAALTCSALSPARAAAEPGVAVPTLYNEANAALRAERVGPAILKYERARFLDPSEPSVLHNLQVARDKAGLEAAAVPGWLRPAHWLGFNGLAAVASVALGLFSLLFFGADWLPGKGLRLARYAAVALGVLTLFSSTALALRWGELGRAVVVAAAPADARIAPAANAAVSFAVKPGEIVSEESVYNDYVRIRTDDGQSGWVAADAVEKIIPSI